MPVDIRFDTIARSYDAQRAHPPQVSEQIGRAIADLTGEGARVLELGIGTGRIALPAVQFGCHVTGIDISREMLRVASETHRANAASGALALLQGDVARLPFAPHQFDAVLAVHVLHLIPDWRGALAEIARVVRPGGVFVQGRDWRDPQSCAERMRAALRDAVMKLVPGARPTGAGAAIAQALGKLGAHPEPEIIAAEWTTHTAPEAILAGMAARADAETWALDDATLEAAVAQVRAAAEAQWPDLATSQPVLQRFVLTPLRMHQPA